LTSGLKRPIIATVTRKIGNRIPSVERGILVKRVLLALLMIIQLTYGGACPTWRDLR